MKSDLYAQAISFLGSLSVLYIGKDRVSELSSILEGKVKTLFIEENINLAMDRVKQDDTSLVIIDLQDIGINSIATFLEVIKGFNSSIQIVCLSNVPMVLDDSVNRDKVGIYYLEKPVNETNLLNVLFLVSLNLFYASNISSKDKVIQSILDIHSSLIVILDSKLRVRYINRIFLQFLNYSNLSEFINNKGGIFSFIKGINKERRKFGSDKEWIELLINDELDSNTISLESPCLLTESFFVLNHKYLSDSQQHIISLTEVTDIVMEKDRLINKLEIDYITGLFNRNKFEMIFQDAISKKRSGEKKLPLSLIFCDIDHFKKVNDTYGHIIGDHVLKELAELILSSIRGEDIATRWGGEEFIILVWRDKDSASIQADRIRLKIEQHRFKNVGHITCSFGVTEFKKGDSRVVLLHRSDSAMYIAKKRGRNQVQVI